MSTIFRHKVHASPLVNGMEVETVTFNDSTFLPLSALSWGMDIMEGWKTTGELEEQSTELGSYRDGVSAASFFPIRRRYITVGGYAYAATELQAEELYDWIIKMAFPRNCPIKLARQEAVPKYVMCRRSSSIEVDWTAVQTGFRWQTTLLCEDPLKYSLATTTVSGGIAGTLAGGHTFPVTFPHTFDSGAGGGDASLGVDNQGSADSPALVATLTGYLGKGAWRLANDTTGEFISFDTAVQTTDELVIDFRAQTALLNGYPISANYLGSYWKLIPGPNTIRLYAEYDASSTVTLEYSSAWE